MINGLGRVYVGKGVVRITMKRDLVEYYRWFIERYYNIRTQTPRHGAHITVINFDLHGTLDLGLVKHYHNRRVEFSYTPRFYVGGGNHRGFYNFWIPVTCDVATDIKNIVGVVDGPSYMGLHMTVGNTKGLDVICPSLEFDNQNSKRDVSA